MIARELPGARNGLAYALAAVEDRERVLVVRSREELLAAIDKSERPLVLYSLSTPSFIEYWREVAEAASKAVVIAGGPQAVGDPLILLRLGVKYAVVGDGEVALPAIVERELGRSDAAPPNTLYLDGGIKAGPRVYVDLDDYRTYSKTLDAYPPVEIMRGCPYRCSFCATWRFGPVRYRSVESVAEMARVYVSKGVKAIRFIAPVGFLYGSRDGKTPNVEALVELLESVKRAGGRPYLGTFPSETRPETVTDEVLDAIKGLVANKKISFGLQTGSHRLLRATKRGHDVETALEAAEVARRHGFTPVVDVIAGLPGEGEEDVEATVAAMERLVKIGAKIRLHYFIPLPGTPMWGMRPAPLHRAYVEFAKRHRPYVEGYWAEQVELSRRIYEGYDEIRRHLSEFNKPQVLGDR